MDTIKSEVEKLLQKELESVNQKFPMPQSYYEGAAVILEEIEKAGHELNEARFAFIEMWRSTKFNESGDAFCDNVLKRSMNLACEAIQVAAMAQKFIDSQEERENQHE